MSETRLEANEDGYARITIDEEDMERGFVALILSPPENKRFELEHYGNLGDIIRIPVPTFVSTGEGA